MRSLQAIELRASLTSDVSEIKRADIKVCSFVLPVFLLELRSGKIDKIDTKNLTSLNKSDRASLKLSFSRKKERTKCLFFSYLLCYSKAKL